MEPSSPSSGTWCEGPDFVLVFFVARWLVALDPSAGRFLDDLEDDLEVVADVVRGVGFFARLGGVTRLGGESWFNIGSIPVPHFSMSVIAGHRKISLHAYRPQPT